MAVKLNYDGEVITKTIETKGGLSGIAFATVQEDFNLSSSDFLRLKDDRNWLHTLSINGLLILFGYFFSLAPRLLSKINGGGGVVEENEWIVLIVGLLVFLIVWLISKAFPSERKKLMKSIGGHFQTSPISRQKIEADK